MSDGLKKQWKRCMNPRVPWILKIQVIVKHQKINLDQYKDERAHDENYELMMKSELYEMIDA